MEEGLRIKYDVYKAESGDKVTDCFVLRPDKDEAAIQALIAYAKATPNKKLGKEINGWLSRIKNGHGNMISKNGEEHLRHTYGQHNGYWKWDLAKAYHIMDTETYLETYEVTWIPDDFLMEQTRGYI